VPFHALSSHSEGDASEASEGGGSGASGSADDPEQAAAADSGSSSSSDSDPSSNGCTVGGQSFTAGTMVLLASGKSEAISKLTVGQKVLATSTKTGKNQVETVTAVLVHHDTDLYDLKVRTGHTTSVIDTTSNHLFWVPAGGGGGGRWVKAGSLKYGTHLRTPGGTDNVVVTGGWIPAQRDGWMWDLTITPSHDFYLNTTAVDVLVHNCGPSQSAPGGQRGPGVSIKSLRMAMGRAGMSVKDYDIQYAENIAGVNGEPAYGASPYTASGAPMMNDAGQPIIEISRMGLSDMPTATQTILHELYHQNMLSTTGYPGLESDAEGYAQEMYGRLFG
jgi:hypothetical protein